MIRRMLVVASLVAIAAALAASASGVQAAKTLKGTVGPGFTISLKQNGKQVKTLKPGAYNFVISDKANVHNFELESESGAKFEKELTHVSFVGTRTVKVTLKKGKWKYYCKPHESIMFGFFKVT